jgi:hypothetical protein
MVTNPGLAMLSPAADRRDLRGRDSRREGVASASPGGAARILLHDICERGALLEADAEVDAGDTIAIDLADGVQAPAKVIWTDGHLFGCTFDRPISTATVSAALRNAPNVEPFGAPMIPADDANRIHWSSTGFAEEQRFSSRTRLLIAVGFGVAAWAIPVVIAALL